MYHRKRPDIITFIINPQTSFTQIETPTTQAKHKYKQFNGHEKRLSSRPPKVKCDHEINTHQSQTFIFSQNIKNHIQHLLVHHLYSQTVESFISSRGTKNVVVVYERFMVGPRYNYLENFSDGSSWPGGVRQPRRRGALRMSRHLPRPAPPVWVPVGISISPCSFLLPQLAPVCVLDSLIHRLMACSPAKLHK